MNILAVESSCDETAVAIVRDGREVLCDCIASQVDLHRIYGGVVPEIASRKHIEAIYGLADQALEKTGLTRGDIDAVAVTSAPGLIGALLVGVNFAKSFAYANKKPLVPVHHIRSHVAANYITSPDLKPPFMALIVSGGHSHIVLVRDYTDYKIIGRTRDDAAGEAFDKAARVMGLGYPGGVYMDKLAKNGDRTAYKFPRVSFDDNPYDFSFSGVKTAIINFLHNAEQKGEDINLEDVAASYSDAVTDVLCDKFLAAAKEYNVTTLAIAGGVSANSMLRQKLESKISKNQTLYMPRLDLCGDNAAMVGAQGYYEYLSDNIAGCDLNARATASIEDTLCKLNG